MMGDYIYIYLLLGVNVGVLIALVEAISSCMKQTSLERFIHVVIGGVFWLPLVILCCGFLIYDMIKKTEIKKQEKEKVVIFNNKLRDGQLVEIEFLNTYRWRKTLGKAKLVKLYYGHRACIPTQFETMDYVMIDLKHVTPIYSNGVIIK